MTPETYVTDERFPHLRAAIYQDSDPFSPLDNWDHGIQFLTLPSAGRTWHNYVEPTSNGAALDIEPEQYREFWDVYWEDDRPDHMQPTLRRYLDTHTAAWVTLDRNGYDGSLDFNEDGDDLATSDAIAYVSRDEFREWHMIPDGKPMPRGYRERARDAIRAVLAEYNAYATGDVYGIVVEYRNDAGEWEDTDHARWGFTGYDHATGDAAREMLAEADCTIEHDGHSYTAGGAVVTPDRATAYLPCGTYMDSDRFFRSLTGRTIPRSTESHPLTDWHGNRIGTFTITSRQAVPSAYPGNYTYHISATIDGRRYYGRTGGPGMIAYLKAYKHQ
jgi:hypothetical protein